MAGTASSTSTRKSLISSITSRTSGTLPPHPYRRIPPPPTKGNEKQSSSSSKKNAPASGHSNDSSRWPTTTPKNSKRSSRTRPSTMTLTGENSTGDQCRNGNNRRRRRTNDSPSAPPSAFHSNCHTAYNPRTDKSNYDDNETPDIVDITEKKSITISIKYSSWYTNLKRS